jgi:hypothetical protein
MSKQKVCVCLTGVPGYDYHAHCWVPAVRLKSGAFSLRGGEQGRAPKGTPWQPYREACKNCVFRPGEEVHVFLVTGGTEGWWEGVIDAQYPQFNGMYYVRWRGTYEGVAKASWVLPKNIRHAQDCSARLRAEQSWAY